MRLSHILPAVLLGLVATAPLASADMLSVPAPAIRTEANIIAVAVRTMVTAVNDVHLRSKPTTSSNRLATLKIGTRVDVLELVSSNTWAKVKYGAKTGYIRADLLK